MTAEDRTRRREFLEQGLSTAYRETDKLVVSVSSAVLALSIAFLDKNKAIHGVCLLWAAWLGLLVAIVCVLVSLLFERHDKRRRIEQLYKGKRETGGATDTFTAVANGAGVITFLIGLISLAAFLCYNTL